MTNREKVINDLQDAVNDDWMWKHADYYALAMERAIALLKEQEAMAPEEFDRNLLEMFSSIWESEIDHPVFQDTVGELMAAVSQLYRQAVKWE